MSVRGTRYTCSVELTVMTALSLSTCHRCYLARATNNSGSIVAVEPDRGVWPRLTRNLATNGCNVSVVLGSVSDAPLLLDNRTQSYGTRTRVAATDSERARAVENLSFDYVQRAIGRPLNALLIDCEGCIGSLLTPQDAPRILERTELILLEHDQPQAVVGGYQSYFDLFRAHGLHQVWLAQDTFKPSEAWSRLLKHSAWVRPRNTRELDVLRHSCRDYARRRNYTRKMLHCLDASQDDPVGAIRAEAHGGLIDKQVEAEIKRHVHCGRRIPLWQCDAWRKLEMHD